MALTGLQGWPLVAGDADILVLLVAVGEQVAQGLGQRLHVEVEERVAVLDGLGGLCWWSGLSALDGTLGSLGGWWRLSLGWWCSLSWWCLCFIGHLCAFLMQFPYRKVEQCLLTESYRGSTIDNLIFINNKLRCIWKVGNHYVFLAIRLDIHMLKTSIIKSASHFTPF